MFEGPLAYFGLQVAKFRFRKEQDAVQPLTEFFRSAKNVLVMLPIGYEDAALAGNALAEVCRKRRNLHITAVNFGTRSTSLSGCVNCQVVRIDQNEIHRFFLPKKPVLQRILDHAYDVAVDMNLDFVLHTAYICKASRAKVRVGCAHQAADFFFNVQLKFDSAQARSAAYKHYVSRLEMF